MAKLEKELESLQKQLDRVRRKHEALAKKFVDSASMGVDVLVKADQECKQQIARFERDISDRERELAEISFADARDAFGQLKNWKKLDLQSKRRALQEVIPQAVMFEDRLELYVANVRNLPIIVPYEPMQKHRKKRDFPEPADWPVISGEGKILRIGARIDLDGKIRAYLPDKR